MLTAAAVELLINSYLHHFGQSDLAADALLKKYNDQKITLPEYEVIANFLLRCGYYASLVEFSVRILEDHLGPISWPHFAEAVNASAVNISNTFKQAIIDGASENGALNHLSRSEALDAFDPSLAQQRLWRRQVANDLYQQKKMELTERLEMFRSQHLKEEEGKTLDELKTLFPFDQDVIQALKAYKERVALDLVAQRSQGKFKSALPAFDFDDHTPDEKKILDLIEKQMLRLAQKHPELAGDFAIGLYLMSHTEGALRVLEFAEETTSNEWLKAEFLLKARRHIELINYLSHLERKYANDPEMTFAALYLRAQALWGLNQKFTAIELIEGLLTVRPQYRSALALLEEWKDGFT